MFRVMWLRTALDELAEVWARVDSTERKLITAATNNIDKRLERDPAKEGESRDARQRILFEFPLAIDFEVPSGQRVVRVLHVWSIRRGS